LAPATYDPFVPDPTPADAVSERSIGAFVVAASLVSVVSGSALAALYRPHEFGWLRTIHAGSAAVALISAIAARVVGSGGRLRLSGRRAAMVVVLVIVLGGAFATGTSLAWRGGTPGDRGVFLNSDSRVTVGNDVVSPGALAVSFVLHTLLGLCSFMLLAGRYVRRWWRQRRTPQQVLG
jgi:hypothetical protein